MKNIAHRLISNYSKSWLADKLGISRPTLDIRLEKDNWKKSEIALLKQLDKIILV
jgi:DNA-binding XRE family transcriptional regulator